MSYNLSGLANLSDPVSLFSWANSQTGDVLFGGFLLCVMVILLVRYREYGFDKALLAGSFVCFVLSMAFRAAGLVSILYVLGFLVVTVLMSVFLVFRSEQ